MIYFSPPERDARFKKWKMAVERSLGWAVTRKSELMTGNDPDSEALARDVPKKPDAKVSVNLSLALKCYLGGLNRDLGRDVIALHAFNQLSLAALACTTIETLSLTASAGQTKGAAELTADVV